ncbi:MAG: NADH-quinone oxidoreductase subunit NuoK [bacterium]
MTFTFTKTLVLTGLIFSLGIYSVLTRRNIVAILLGIELMLNASALNIVAFSRFHGNPIDGQVTAIFIIVLAACEAAIAFGLLMNFYRNIKSVEIDNADRLNQ